MQFEQIIAIGLVAIVAVGALIWWAGQRRRTEQLKDRFGPEYARTVETADDRKRAEQELQARQERIDALDIRPLSAKNRARFGERWRVVQSLFVDDPSMAVEQADTLIGEVMRARGYPVGDFEQRAADVSVNHPQVVDHYRTAHKIAERRATTDVNTEALRQAFVHYRALFADLLETADAHERADENLSRAADERAADAEATPAPTDAEPVAAATAEAAPAPPPAAHTRDARTTDAETEPAEPARRP